MEKALENRLKRILANHFKEGYDQIDLQLVKELGYKIIELPYGDVICEKLEQTAEQTINCSK